MNAKRHDERWSLDLKLPHKKATAIRDEIRVAGAGECPGGRCAGTKAAELGHFHTLIATTAATRLKRACTGRAAERVAGEAHV